MKLAKLILPERDNNNESLSWQHQALQDILIARYGGFTMTKSGGCWEGPQNRIKREPVWVYDIAMERAAVVDFRTLAADTARDCKQDCVMIVTPQGDVEFVKPSPENKSAPTP